MFIQNFPHKIANVFIQLFLFRIFLNFHLILRSVIQEQQIGYYAEEKKLIYETPSTSKKHKKKSQ